jgi:hypothetical protein
MQPAEPNSQVHVNGLAGKLPPWQGWNSLRRRPARHFSLGIHAERCLKPIRRQTSGPLAGPAERRDSLARDPEENTMADENLDGRLDENDEFEEITSDEVDRVVEQLEKLMETVSSENIKAYLEEAVNNIFFLLYDDEDSAEAA